MPWDALDAAMILTCLKAEIPKRVEPDLIKYEFHMFLTFSFWVPHFEIPDHTCGFHTGLQWWVDSCRGVVGAASAAWWHLHTVWTVWGNHSKNDIVILVIRHEMWLLNDYLAQNGAKIQQSILNVAIVVAIRRYCESICVWVWETLFKLIMSNPKVLSRSQTAKPSCSCLHCSDVWVQSAWKHKTWFYRLIFSDCLLGSYWQPIMTHFQNILGLSINSWVLFFAKETSGSNTVLPIHFSNVLVGCILVSPFLTWSQGCPDTWSITPAHLRSIAEVYIQHFHLWVTI